MAKLIQETIHIVALAKGETADGRQYTLARVKGAQTGTMRTHILNDDEIALIGNDTVEGIAVSGTGVDRVWTDTDEIDLGQGSFYNVPAPAPTIRRYEVNGEERKRPSLTISGLLLNRRNDSLAAALNREMVNRCYNGDYLAVAGVDYSRWRLPELGEFTEYDKVLMEQLGSEE